MRLFRAMRAFSLIEVLIAWFILCVAFLSLLFYEMDGLNLNLRAYRRVQAVLQVNSIMEQLRANKDAAFRNREINSWNQVNQELLPNALGAVSCSGYECEVKLTWGASQQESFFLREII